METPDDKPPINDIAQGTDCAMRTHPGIRWRPPGLRPSSRRARRASGDIPRNAAELARALVPLLGETGASYAFMIGFLAVPVTSTIGLCLLSAMGIHEVMGDARSKSRIWNLGIMVQIALLNCVAITYVFNRLSWWQS